MRNIWIIAGREFRLYFVSPVAYAVAGMCLLILGGLFALRMSWRRVRGFFRRLRGGEKDSNEEHEG